MSAPPPHPHLAWLVLCAFVALTLVGAGLYRALPLVQDPDELAAQAVEDYVRAWAEARCEEAAELIAGPRDDVVAACLQVHELRRLRIASTRVDVHGEIGTAEFELTWRRGGQLRHRTVVERLVRVEGVWKVLWQQ